MRTLDRTSLLVCVLLLGVAACELPGIPQAAPIDDATSIAQTVVSIVEETQHAASVTFSPVSPTPIAALTLQFSTLPVTETQTLTTTPELTATPLWPSISVSVPTNCRTGPGKVYEMVGALLVGEIVQVYARDPTGMYWYIRNPDSEGEFCWVWGQYATLYGITALLPVYTPPPTPTPTLTPSPAPGFEASYDGLVSCSSWWPEIKLKNTGSITFESVGIMLKDTVTSSSVSAITDGFVDHTDCSSSASKKTLLPGKAVTVSAPAFAYDPTGHKLRATITLCSDIGLNGFCITETISFTP